MSQETVNVPVPPELESVFVARGLNPPEELKRDGQWHPCDAEDDDPGEGNGRYCAPVDEPFVVHYQNWKDGADTQTWSGNGRARKLSPEERRQVEALRSSLDRERDAMHAKAAVAVRKIWARADPATPDHPYLKAKGIKPDGLRVKSFNPHKGALCIPLYSPAGDLVNLQYIASEPDAEGKFPRRYHPGALRVRTYCAFGPWPPKPTGGIVEVEGAATAISVHESTRGTVVAAMDAGNLLPVAVALRKKYPRVRITFFADNDRSRVGIMKATKAAEAVDGNVCMSPREGDDAADLYRREGPGAVRAVLASAKKVGEWNTEHTEGRDPSLASVGMGVDGVRPTRSPATPLHLELVRGDQVVIRNVDWLMRDKLPLGKLVILAGEPGTGKSRLSLSFAAVVTRGGQWPARHGKSVLGEVLLANFEDDPEDTSAPRLRAEGADLSRVHFLKGVSGGGYFDVVNHLGLLDQELTAHPDVRYLVVDPISAALGHGKSGIDSHNNSDVRSALRPLAEVAARHRVCVVGVTHFNKGTNVKAIARVIGSIAFVAAARVAFVVLKDPDNPERHLMLQLKNNLAPDRDGLAFRTEEVLLQPEGVTAVRVIFEPEPVGMVADEVMADRSQANSRARAAAEDFLLAQLEDGPKPAVAIFAAAIHKGISERTLTRAKHELRVESRRAGKGPWVWALPGAAEGGPPPVTRQPWQPSKKITLQPKTGAASPKEANSPKSWHSSPKGAKKGKEAKIAKKGKIAKIANRRRPT
jgi:putative DNA primase/helicase